MTNKFTIVSEVFINTKIEIMGKGHPCLSIADCNARLDFRLDKCSFTLK